MLSASIQAAQQTFSCRFEVFFVGAESKIDMRESGEWLHDRTSQWSFPVHIQASHLRFDNCHVTCGWNTRAQDFV